MLKRYRYRAYLTRPDQVTAVAKTFGCARVVYNDVIHDREQAHKAGLPFPKSGDLQKLLITQAKLSPERAWLADTATGVLQQAVQDADRAYRNFFQSLSGKRKGARVGKPRFKSRRDNRQTARFTRSDRFKVWVVNRERALVRLPHIGELALAYSRPLPSDPSSVTLIREPDGNLYVSFVVDVPEVEPMPETNRHAAIDLGLTDYAAVVATDGTRSKVENPRFLRSAEKKLRRAQQSLSRKEKGSKNRAKARAQVARAHRKVRETRLDHAHKLALTLVRENQTISVEQLNVKGLARAGASGRKGRGLRKSVHDAAWGQFLRILTEKAAWHGRTIIALNPAYTSQCCSVCGVLDGPKPLDVREWECGGCGAWLDRDWNAAVNLLVAAGHAETLNACGGDIRLVLARAVSGEAGTTPLTDAA